MNNFKIGNKEVGGSRTYIIAEIGQAHDGSLGSAYSYIDAVADTGVDAVKFQTHIADAESTVHETFRVNVFPQDKSRYEYWKRMEFTKKQWRDLANYARNKDLEFLSTPFSVEAVKLLEEIDIPAWKIGSGDITNIEMINEIVKTRKPVLISSGMSSFKDLEVPVNIFKKNNITFCIFQCTTSYPCAPEDIGYNLIKELQDRFNCNIGLSDHSGTIFPSIASVALGAKIVEVHAVFSKLSFGPDTSSSLEIPELKKMVEGIRFIERGINNTVDKDKVAESKLETRNLFGRSAFYSKNLDHGDIIKEGDIMMKKPGGGLQDEDLSFFYGKKLVKKISKDDFVKFGDVE